METWVEHQHRCRGGLLRGDHKWLRRGRATHVWRASQVKEIIACMQRLKDICLNP